MVKALLIVGILLALPISVYAQTPPAPPSCEEQLALSNQLIQDVNQENWALKVREASRKLPKPAPKPVEPEKKNK